MPAGEREDQNDQEGQGMLDSFTGRGKHVVKDTANGQQVGVKKADGQGINSNIAANQKDDKDYKDYEDDDETF
nr:hypothetical protein BaRGS_018437 [Batillaria attramentaria]